MIIRAVSDDEADDWENDSQSMLPGSPYASCNARSAKPLHGAKVAWILLSVAVVVLLLFDLSAMLSQLAARNDVTALADCFALGPFVLQFVLRSMSASSVSTTPGTAINNFIGLGLVFGWIYVREQRLNRRQRAHGVPGGSLMCTLGLPYSALVGVLCCGHVVSCLYVLMALFESNGDAVKFWLGNKNPMRARPKPML
ncbi:TPA: hypothetical protein N0F65_007305 [Lagenidium giganteum]|uniref:Uncharacterized protein n=1 Tax=Lagenidium giganteum TaxID=4803 RepID=A0AAV2Z1Y6_9STRA|nr:TPA: hypothetical protein N0F65_007305 [Lagenidium giganteum]